MRFGDTTGTLSTVSSIERKGQSDVEPGTISRRRRRICVNLPDRSFPVYIIRENPDTEAHLLMISGWLADLPSYKFESG